VLIISVGAESAAVLTDALEPHDRRRRLPASWADDQKRWETL